MARKKTSESPRLTELQVIRLLTEAAAGDTVYRDLYLQRAAERLAPLLSPAEYNQLKGQKT